MRVAIETLGCKLNQAETEALTKKLVMAGYQLVSSADKADIYVLNTCTVTQVADAKSRRLLRLAHRQNPDVLVVVTGCYAQRDPQGLGQIEGVGLIVGNADKQDLPRLLQQSGYAGNRISTSSNAVIIQPLSARTRAFVKIQDGCSNFCAYCIVPTVRGCEKSLPLKDVMTEVNDRLANGYKEVVLTGTKVGSYRDNDVNLKGLLESILSETHISRVRLSSLQPQEMSPELIELWRDSRLCPHFHLSLQSGSDGVLRRMQRRYTVEDYQGTVALIRELVPGVAITTDVIVGFPGETETEFEESFEVCRRLQFARIHVFAYSLRSGTLASRLPEQIDSQVKKRRSQKMLALAVKSAQNFQRQFAGQTRPVLWTQRSGDRLWSGLTDNYIKISSKSDEDLTNRLLPVKLV